jgi:hypothetical protein
MRHPFWIKRGRDGIVRVEITTSGADPIQVMGRVMRILMAAKQEAKAAV